MKRMRRGRRGEEKEEEEEEKRGMCMSFSKTKSIQVDRLVDDYVSAISGHFK